MAGFARSHFTVKRDRVRTCPEISSALVTQQIIVETQQSTQKGRTYFWTTSKEQLAIFISQGEGDAGGLRWRILNRLQEVVEERNTKLVLLNTNAQGH